MNTKVRNPGLIVILLQDHSLGYGHNLVFRKGFYGTSAKAAMDA